MPPEQSNLTELFTDLYADDHGLDNDIDEDAAKDWNTSIADYVWLPLRFDREMAVIDWHDEWRRRGLRMTARRAGLSGPSSLPVPRRWRMSWWSGRTTAT